MCPAFLGTPLGPQLGSSGTRQGNRSGASRRCLSSPGSVATPRYLVAGQTHPKVLRREGEAYRSRLQERVMELGLATTVTFDGHYRHREALPTWWRRPMSSYCPMTRPTRSHRECSSRQSRRGVRSIATRFPHAVEMLKRRGGILVPHQDPTAIADALRTRPDAPDRRCRRARWFGRGCSRSCGQPLPTVTVSSPSG